MSYNRDMDAQTVVKEGREAPSLSKVIYEWASLDAFPLAGRSIIARLSELDIIEKQVEAELVLKEIGCHLLQILEAVNFVLFYLRGFTRSSLLNNPKQEFLIWPKTEYTEELQNKTPLKSTKAAQTVDKNSSLKPAVREGLKRLLTEGFNCRASDIYDILMDDNRWKGFSQSNAKISREVGGSFSLFDGVITGVNQELQQGNLIVQKWRFSNWIDGHYSTVYMTFEEPDSGVIIVKLKQTDVPEKDRYGNATVVENTERGWKELIFHEIRAVFGYGM